MLVLSRKVEEVIRIGDDIQVKVLRIDGNRVKLGIVAPRDVRVLRHELQSEETRAAIDIDSETDNSAAKNRPANSAEMQRRVAQASGMQYHDDAQQLQAVCPEEDRESDDWKRALESMGDDQFIGDDQVEVFSMRLNTATGQIIPDQDFAAARSESDERSTDRPAKKPSATENPSAGHRRSRLAAGRSCRIGTSRGPLRDFLTTS